MRKISIMRPASANAITNPYRVRYSNLFPRLVIVIALLSFAAACGGANEVLKVSTEADALEIIDVLSKYNIEATKEEVGSDDQKEWVVKVSSDVETTLVTQILTDHSLPRPKEATEETSSIFVPTEQERKQKELRLKKRDIERQLRQLPGVTSADVTIVPSEDPYFKVDPIPAKANVVLRYKEIKPAEEHVQSMVASSVERLAAADVNVMLVSVPPRGNLPSNAGGGKRNPVLLAVGIGLVVLIPFLLVVLILQNRRNRDASLSPANQQVEIVDDKDRANLLESEQAKQIRAKPPILLKEGLEENVTKHPVSDQAKSAS